MLLLDVDGVLNPFAAETCPEGYREYSFFPGEEPVRLCVPHGDWLAGLAERYELVWATGWEDDANRVLAPVLSLPSLPVIRFPPAPFAPAAKMPPIAAFTGDRPVAWLDDAHPPEAHHWARTRRAPTLLITVDPAQGLMPSMIDTLTHWPATG
jgi:hypothetical protein